MSKNNLRKIRIIPTESWNVDVYLDDIDIGGWVNKIEFTLSANDPIPVIKLTIVGIPEIPENLAAIVSAEVMEIE